MRWTIALVLAVLCVGGFGARAYAQNETWTGKSSGKWSDPGNWSPTITTLEGYPDGESFNVTIPTPPSNTNAHPAPTLDVSASVGSLKIQNLEQLTIPKNCILTVYGDITNNYQLNVEGGGIEIASATRLTGSGSLAMPDGGIIGDGTLTNEQLIQSSGSISVTNLTNAPHGSIQGISSSQPLIISSKNVNNQGTIGTLGTGKVKLVGRLAGEYQTTMLNLQNAGGAVSGGTGQIQLDLVKISGGKLNGRVVILPDELGMVLLNSVTNLGEVLVASGDAKAILEIQDFVNDGTIQVTTLLAPNAKPAGVILSGQLSGTGGVTLAGQGAAFLPLRESTIGQTISAGPYGIIIPSDKVVLNGRIEGGSSSSPLTIESGAQGVANMSGTGSIAGSVRAYEMSLNGLTLDTSSGGAISLMAKSAAVDCRYAGNGTVFLEGATMIGGFVGPEATAQVPGGQTATLEGTIENNGTISLDAANAPGDPQACLKVDGEVTLTGIGQITTSENPNNCISGSGTISLDGNHLISYGGAIDVPFNIHKGSSVDANGTTRFSMSIFNQGGEVEVDEGAKLLADIENAIANGPPEVSPKSSPATQTLTGGVWSIAGTLAASNLVDPWTNNAQLALTGGGAIEGANGVNFLPNLIGNGPQGVLTLSSGGQVSTAGSFTNQGLLTIGNGSSLTSKGFTQTGSGALTTVNNALVVNSGGSIDIEGGKLASAGTIYGNLTVGNASGNAATFVAGNANTTEISVQGAYTQLATGTLILPDVNAMYSQYAPFYIAGTATLSGNLQINFEQGYTPPVGIQFIVLTAESEITGKFSKVSWSAIPNESVEVEYSGQNVTAKIVAGP